MISTSPHRIRLIGLAALIVLIAALACGPANTPPVVVDQIPAPTATTAPSAEATTAQATAEPTAAPGEPTADPNAPTVPAANANFQGMSFFYDLDMASSWQAEIVPADPNAEGAPEAWLLPSHYRFTFNDYPNPGSMHQPRLLIFPIDNFEGYNEHGLGEIEKMRTLLEERPTDFSQYTTAPGANPIPFVPIFNAAQVFAARIEYIDFQNGRGIRFLTQYDQAVNPITNETVFYTFQGITDDDKYYVAAIFPLSHPSLPANFGELSPEEQEPFGSGEGFEEYLTGIVQTLNDAAPEEFTPDLRLLDTFIRSLTVQPTTG